MSIFISNREKLKPQSKGDGSLILLFPYLSEVTLLLLLVTKVSFPDQGQQAFFLAAILNQTRPTLRHSVEPTSYYIMKLSPSHLFLQ